MPHPMAMLLKLPKADCLASDFLCDLEHLHLERQDTQRVDEPAPPQFPSPPPQSVLTFSSRESRTEAGGGASQALTAHIQAQLGPHIPSTPSQALSASRGRLRFCLSLFCLLVVEIYHCNATLCSRSGPPASCSQALNVIHQGGGSGDSSLRSLPTPTPASHRRGFLDSPC